jgi:tryptophan-rich sensory protein
MSTKAKNLIGLLFWFLGTFAVSALGAKASIQASEFYTALVQPAWAPPPWVFGPVWSALYTLMAIAAWLVWRSGGFRKNALALGLFICQLLLNALWSWLFFAWQLGGPAFFEVLILWASILATLWAFFKVRKLAGVLLLPYLLWVTFAAALNFSLWRMNPVILG